MKNTLKQKCSSALILIFFSTLPFLGSLRAPFFYDDYNVILLNDAIKSACSPLKFFSELESFSAQRIPMFRPLVVISYWLNWRWCGQNPFGWHIVDLIFHLFCVVLVYLILVELSGSLWVGFLAGLFFGIHPSRVGAVAYISARSELFASLFYLFSFWLFLLRKEGKKRNFLLGFFSLILFCLGLACKSIVITLPLILTLERIIFRRLKKRDFIWLVAFWVVFAGYFLLRWLYHLYTFFPPARPRGVWENLILQSRVVVYYLRWLLFPAHFAVEVKFSPVGSLEAILSVLFLVGVLVLAVYLIKSRFWLEGFFILFFFIVLSPSSSFVPLVVEGAIRRCYLAGLGIFVLFARWIDWLLERSQAKILATSCTLILFFLLGTLCGLWAKTWNQPTKLWRKTIENFPNHPRAHNNLGILLERKGNCLQAEREYKWAITIDPNYSHSLNNYARLLFSKGELKESEKYFQKAIQSDPSNCSARINYSNLLISEGKLKQAQRILAEAGACPQYKKELEHQKKRLQVLLGEQ